MTPGKVVGDTRQETKNLGRCGTVEVWGADRIIGWPLARFCGVCGSIVMAGPRIAGT
jgi:hypothetical protein